MHREANTPLFIYWLSLLSNRQRSNSCPISSANLSMLHRGIARFLCYVHGCRCHCGRNCVIFCQIQFFPRSMKLGTEPSSANRLLQNNSKTLSIMRTYSRFQFANVKALNFFVMKNLVNFEAGNEHTHFDKRARHEDCDQDHA